MPNYFLCRGSYEIFPVIFMWSKIAHPDTGSLNTEWLRVLCFYFENNGVRDGNRAKFENTTTLSFAHKENKQM